MTDVVPIRAGLLPPSTGEADPNVVKQLAELLEAAKSGEIIGFTYAALHPGEVTSFHRSGRNTRGMIGALVLLQHDMCKTDLENS